MTYSAAPVIIATRRAEQRVAEALRGQGATSADAAVTLHPDRLIQRRALRRLVRAGVVRQTGKDRYWLDDAGFDRFVAYRRSSARRVLGWAVVVAAILVVAALWLRLA